jgi:hypothetical protein
LLSCCGSEVVLQVVALDSNKHIIAAQVWYGMVGKEGCYCTFWWGVCWGWVCSLRQD